MPQLPDPLVVMALEEESGETFRRSSIPVLYTGVGKVNAAYSLTRKLAEYACGGQLLPMVVNFGTAGSSSFPVGSIVACKAFVQRDMDVTALGFDIGTTPFDPGPALISFPVLLKGIPHGICGTGDSFSTMHSNARYDVVDMEAFSLAKVCWFYGSRFTSVKYITDGADVEAGRSWKENLHLASQHFMTLYEQLSSDKCSTL